MRKIPWWQRWIRVWSVLRLLLWTIWVIYRERKRVLKARARGNYEVQPNIEVLINVLVAFRQTAIKLGVLMIKLGQFLSSRADLLPEQALEVLITLQDEVPPEPFEHVIYMIESEFSKPVGEIFSKLEPTCTAAASLGQVHKAVLAKTGETVAVKIQRPNIEQLVRMDLRTLRFAIRLITRLVDSGDFIDLWGIYREFRRTVFEEVDFAHEAANAQRFRTIFKDDPTIYIPRVYEEYVTRRIIVLEWVDGIKINDYPMLDAFEIDRLEVARRTVNAYFRQFFEEGFFHADPHPGNIFVKQGSHPNQPVIAFLDFGMTGSITNYTRRCLRELFLAIVARDPTTVVQGLIKLGFIGEGANLASIERAVSMLMDQYIGITLGQSRDLHMSAVGRDIIDLLYGQPFHIPAHFAFSGRAVGTLVGVTTGLAPNLNFIEEATPYARRFLGLDAQNIGEMVQEIVQRLVDNGRVLSTLPHAVERFMNHIQTGQVEVRLANLVDRRSHHIPVSIVGGGFSIALMFLSSLLGGIYLTNIHLYASGWFCLGLAAVTALGMIMRK